MDGEELPKTIERFSTKYAGEAGIWCLPSRSNGTGAGATHFALIRGLGCYVLGPT